MITIFNRRELTIVHTMKQQAQIRDLLDASHVKYYVTVDSIFNRSTGKGRMGSIGVNLDTAYQYTFYVHKNDHEMAQAILNGTFRS